MESELLSCGCPLEDTLHCAICDRCCEHCDCVPFDTAFKQLKETVGKMEGLVREAEKVLRSRR